MADIFDIAKLAGVSKSTVSRVMNNQPGVKEDKRKKVLQIIEETNYSPNAMARGLVTKRSHTFAIFIREIANTFYAEYMRHLYYIADENNYGTIFCQVNHHANSNINYIEMLNKKVDGFIFIGEDTVSKREIDMLLQDKCPMVIIQNSFDLDTIIHFKIDNTGAYRKGTEYLQSLGHTYILNISGPTDQFEFLERNQGYNQVMAANSRCQGFTLYTDYEMESSYEHAKKLARQIKADKITAAICSNNVIATGFIDGLIAAGIHVPEEFSVIGFDDVIVAEHTHNYIPPITSIAQPQRLIANETFKSMMKQIEAPNEKGSTTLYSCEIRIRKTTQERSIF